MYPKHIGGVGHFGQQAYLDDDTSKFLGPWNSRQHTPYNPTRKSSLEYPVQQKYHIPHIHRVQVPNQPRLAGYFLQNASFRNQGPIAPLNKIDLFWHYQDTLNFDKSG